MNRRSGLFSTSLHTKIPRFRVVCDPRQLDVISHITSSLALASKRTHHLLRIRGVFGPLNTTPTSIGTTSSSSNTIPTSNSATPSSSSATPSSSSATPTSSSATPTSLTSNINHHNNPYHHHHHHHCRPIPMVCNEPSSSSKTGKDRGVHLLPSLLLPPPLFITGGAGTGVGVGVGTKPGSGVRNGQGTGTGVGSGLGSGNGNCVGVGMGNGQVGMLHYPNATTLPRFSSRKGCTSSSLVHTFQSLYPSPRYSKNCLGPTAVITSSPTSNAVNANPCPGPSAVITPSPSSSAWARAIWHHLFDLILSDIRRAKYVPPFVTSIIPTPTTHYLSHFLILFRPFVHTKISPLFCLLSVCCRRFDRLILFLFLTIIHHLNHLTLSFSFLVIGVLWCNVFCYGMGVL